MRKGLWKRQDLQRIIADTGKKTVKTSELPELSGKKENEFSQYRVRLSNKGVIDIRKRGFVSVKLPGFSEFVREKAGYYSTLDI